MLGDSLEVLPRFADGSFQLIYVDPPFNTGSTAHAPDARGGRATSAASATGFGGRRYRTRLLAESSYRDEFDDYLGFLEPRLREARRLLSESGTLYVHLDYREAHYVKLLLDELFGRELLPERDHLGLRLRRQAQVAAGPPSTTRSSSTSRTAARYFFDGEAVDREPYMAPGLVTAEKAARGKLPTDVIWHTIVPTNGAEKTGYPTQKPEGLVRRFVQASSRPGDWCLDFFAGSGTLGAVAAKLGRRYVLVDENPEAVEVMRQRLAALAVA